MRRSRVPRTTSWEWDWFLDEEGDMSASELLLSNTDTNMGGPFVESQQQSNQQPVRITLGDEVPGLNRLEGAAGRMSYLKAGAATEAPIFLSCSGFRLPRQATHA